MKQNIVATAIVDVNKNIKTGASAPVLIVPTTGTEVAEATKEVGSLKNLMFVVSVLGPNKVSITIETGQEMPKGSVLMSSPDIKTKFSGFRIFKTSEEGTFTGVFFGEGIVGEDHNTWLRWLGLLAQESCKALWASVVELCKEFKHTMSSEGFLAALKALWGKFLTWAKAKCQELWKALCGLWERFMGIFSKKEDKKEDKKVEVAAEPLHC